MEQAELRAALCALLGRDYLAAGMQVVVYGSRRRTRDIDIVVVQPQETATPSLKVGQLDLFVVSRKRFDRLLGVLDLLAVEPALTGELVYGDAPAWSAVRDRLVETPPSGRCVEHACRRSLEEYLVACRLWEQYEQDGDPELPEWAFVNLSFSVSYASFARFYAQPGSKACTLDGLIRAEKVFLPEFWAFRNGVKQKNDDVEADSVGDWLSTWGRTILHIDE